jgi:hypothetical protein
MSQQTDLSPALALSIDLVFGIVKRAARAEELLESVRGQCENLREHFFQTDRRRIARIEELETELAAAHEAADHDLRLRALAAELLPDTPGASLDTLIQAARNLHAQAQTTSGPLCVGDTVEIVSRQPGDPEIGYRAKVDRVDRDGDVYFNDAAGRRRVMYAREVRRVSPPQQVSKPLAVLPEYCERLPDDELGPIVRTLTYPKTRIEINDPYGAELCVTQEDAGTITLDIAVLRAYLTLVPVRGDSPA